MKIMAGSHTLFGIAKSFLIHGQIPIQDGHVKTLKNEDPDSPRLIHLDLGLHWLVLLDFDHAVREDIELYCDTIFRSLNSDELIDRHVLSKYDIRPTDLFSFNIVINITIDGINGNKINRIICTYDAKNKEIQDDDVLIKKLALHYGGFYEDLCSIESSFYTLEKAKEKFSARVDEAKSIVRSEFENNLNPENIIQCAIS